jgi:hypothetical protein
VYLLSKHAKPSRLTAMALAITAALTLAPLPGRPASGAPVIAYRGLGAWVDIYDGPYWDNPESLVGNIARKGVRTLYLQTCNAGCPGAIHRPRRVARFIHAAHARGMHVVAWYLPEFDKMARDRARSRAAIQFETSLGQRFDSFALDIESLRVASVEVRNRRTVRLSEFLRGLVGPDYPLGAIVPPFFYPWPRFPYRALGSLYDVFLPMNYFTGQVQGPAGARDHTERNIRTIRRGTGIRTVPIHSVGGLAANIESGELRALIRTGREYGILGTSLYDADTSPDWQWRPLRTVPANPRQSPALPARFGKQIALGNLAGSDRSHPKEAWYRTGPIRGPRALRFQAAAIDQGEVALLVNWRKVKGLAPTASWSPTRTVVLPGKLFRRNGPNRIGFVADGAFPDWEEWAVRRVDLGPA